MAVAFVRDHTGVSIKTSGTTNIGVNISTATTAGDTLVARILFDNYSTASLPTVTSIAKAAGETANWVFLGAARSTNATLGANSSGEMWAIKTTVSWPVASYTVTLSHAVVMKATDVREFFGVEAALRSTVGTAYSATTAAASAVTTGTAPQVGDMAVGFIFGSNYASAQAGSNNTTGGTWSTPSGLGSTGGNIATNNYGVAQYKILTAASHQTYANSAAMTAANGSIVAILQKTPEITPVASFSADKTTAEVGSSFVTFTDTSTNYPSTWSWNFGTGASPATASTKGPHAVNYNTVGTSTVTLTAGNGAGSDAADPLNITVVPMVNVLQLAYGFYSTGTETGSTPLAAQDTAINGDVSLGDVNLHLRVRIQETAGGIAPATDDWNIQYEKNSSGTWTVITNITANVAAYSDPSIQPSGPTTQRLTSGTGSFVTGQSQNGAGGTVQNFGLSANNHTELLFMVTLKAANLAHGDTIKFRPMRNAASFGAAPTPTITVVKVIPKVETLIDDFSVAATVEKWPEAYGLVGWDPVGKRMSMTERTAPPDYSGILTPIIYTLMDSYVFVKMTRPAVQTNSTETTMTVRDTTAANSISVILFYDPAQVGIENQVCLRLTVASVTNNAFVNYDAATMAYWRVRQGSGNYYWDSSPDGSTWTNRRTLAHALVLNQVGVELSVGQWEAGELTQDTGYFDNVNVVPAGGGPQTFYQDLTDTVTVTASHVDSVKKTLTDTVTVTASGGGTMTKTLSDTVTVTAASTVRSVTKSLTDTVSTTATGIRALTKSLVKTVVGTPSIANVVTPAGGQMFYKTLIAVRGEPSVEWTDATGTWDGTASWGEDRTGSVFIDAQITYQTGFLEYFRDVVASPVTVLVSLRWQAAKSLSDSVLTSGVLARTSTRVMADTVAITSALARSSNRVLTDTVSTTSVVSRSSSRALSTGVTASSSVLRSSVKSLSAGSVAGTASLLRQTGKPLSVVVTGAASARRALTKRVTSSTATSATVGRAQSVLRTVSAAVTTTATVSRAQSVTRTLAATQFISATIDRGQSMQRTLSAASATTASMSRAAQRTLIDTVTATSTMARSAAKTVPGTVVASASMRLVAGRVLVSDVVGSFVSMSRVAGKLVRGTPTVTASIARYAAFQRTVSAGVATAAAMLRKTIKQPLFDSVTVTSVLTSVNIRAVNLAATITATPTLVRNSYRTLADTVASTATFAIVRGRILTAVPVTVTATVRRSALLAQTAMVSTVGTVRRAVVKALDSATLTSTAFIGTIKGRFVYLTATVPVTATMRKAITSTVPKVIVTITASRPFKVIKTPFTGSFTAAAVVAKTKLSYQALSAVITGSATLRRAVSTQKTMVVTGTAALTRKTNKVLARVVTITGSRAQAVGRVLTDTVIATPSLVKNAQVSLNTYAVIISAQLSRALAKQLTDLVTTFASSTQIRSLMRTLTASVTTIGSIRRAVTRTITTMVPTVASAIRSMTHTLSDSVVATVTITSRAVTSRVLSAAVSTSASLRRAVAKPLADTVTIIPTVTRLSKRSLISTVAVIGTLTRQFQRTLSDIVLVTPSLRRTVDKTLAASILILAFLNRIRATVRRWSLWDGEQEVNLELEGEWDGTQVVDLLFEGEYVGS